MQRVGNIMPKYGRGLNREIVAEVNKGNISEPFSIVDVRTLIARKKWKTVTENYINCCLANGSSESHSGTYKKYFVSLGDGKYRVRDDFKGVSWT